MKSESYWLGTGKRRHFPTLESDLNAETVVVGAGIAGILTAWHLIKRGYKVTLFERFEILNGTTGNTTAKLSAQHGLIYDELIQRYGSERARLYYQANMRGIQLIKDIAKELELGDLVTDETVYTYTTDPKKRPTFEKEKAAYEKLGIKGEQLKDSPLGFEIELALSMQNQGVFHPVEFLNAVLSAAVNRGLQVFEHTTIEDMTQLEDDTLQLKSRSGHQINCKDVVFATHYPQIETDDFYDQLWARTTHALAYKTDKKLFEGAHIAYDTPSVTLRTMEYFGEHYFLIGGQSHGTGDGFSDKERYSKIHQLAQKLFDVKEPAFKWCSHDLMTKDRIPFIGQLHPDFTHAYTITGLNAWGLANSSIGALVLTDLISGKDNPYIEMYHPFREIKPLKSKTEKEKSSSPVAEVQSLEVEALENDQLTTITHNDKTVGVYKDANGKVHYYSLKCTHHGCGLGLNDGDKTWDCPCHGSRFDKTGKVIYGPAIENLEEVDLS